MTSSVLFKYLEKREFIDGMITQGIVRVGTLSEYRAYEERDIARRDAGEGRKTLLDKVPDRIISGAASPEDLSAFREFGIGLPVGTHDVAMIDCAVGQPLVVPDAYIYSTAEIFDEELMKDFSAAGAVVITNPPHFFRAISRALGKRRVSGMAFQRCVYAPREHFRGTVPDVNPCWLKPVSYSAQKEVRAAWEPVSLPIAAELLEVPEVPLFCEEYVPGKTPSSGRNFVGRTLERLTLDLDGLSLKECTLRNCTLIYSGHPYELESCQLDDCDVALTDAAARTASLFHRLRWRIVRPGDGASGSEAPMQESSRAV